MELIKIIKLSSFFLQYRTLKLQKTNKTTTINFIAVSKELEKQCATPITFGKSDNILIISSSASLLWNTIGLLVSSANISWPSNTVFCVSELESLLATH